jgi:hypothetical protein
LYVAAHNKLGRGEIYIYLWAGVNPNLFSAV